MVELTARWHRAMAEIPEAQWHALTAADPIPFYSWRWLVRLERSGSVVPRQGWQPCHLGLWQGEQLIAAAPLYLKGHSYGEFVFDQSFAQLAAQLGHRYYPKLLGMSPLSPVVGYRFFTAPGQDAAALTPLMLELIDGFCRENGIFSCNFLYVDPQWRPLAEAAGCHTWLNQQSLWSNQGYTCFDDYLASFNANQRRNIKRERKAVQAAGLSVTPLVGEAIGPRLLQRMHHFYAQHCARWGPWGSKYLTAEFFEHNADELRPSLVLFSAHRGDPQDPVAMSLCVHSQEQLWGRYWGSDVEVENLHFEVCYYAPIAWAIANGVQRFDPGAGGSHKRRRGFVARPHASLHRWYDEEFETILRRWLPEANREQLAEIEAVNAELPFTASAPSLAEFKAESAA
ncbi:MAG: N-acetyltransferase [Synechococcaceae bacterium WBB_3_034]|nr:N-acetyltransferase [Synechococcaceae bacterium WBB_3_034]NDG22654.1 N-acetyltransferase [Synechococcaceae bacterium WBB_10_009]